MTDVFNPYRDVLSYAPDLSLAPSMLSSVAKLPGDRRRNAQSGARAIQVAAHHKALKQATDNEDEPGLVARALDWISHHSFASRELGTYGKTSAKLKRDQAALQTRARALGIDPADLADYEQGRATIDQHGRLVPVPGAVTQAMPASLAIDPRRAQQNLNAGLAEAQHQYRALRDIQQTHGTVAALTEGTGIAVAGTGGAFLAGAPGAALAAEATAGITERTFFRDSWERTQNGEGYRDGAGHAVSVGRDVARLVGLKDGSLPFTALSGALDGLADVYADPVANAAGLARGYNATEQAAGGLLGRVRGDTVIRSASDIEDIAARRPGVMRVFNDIANKQAGEIARDYPAFTPLVKDLGEARTAEAVKQVFVDAATMGELRGESLPIVAKNTRRIATEPLTGAETDPVVGRLGMFSRRLRSKLPVRYDPETGAFTHMEVDPASNRPSDIAAVRASLKFGNLSDRVVDGTMNDYVLAENSAERRTILRNAWVRGFIAQATREDPGADPDVLNQLAAKLKVHITQEMGGTGGMEGADYGYDVLGNSLSPLRLQDGSSATAAIYTGQRGLLRMPQYAAWVRTAREQAGGAQALYGRLDDFAFSHIIVPFKSLALVTGGFAIRVGGIAEGVPAAFREGLVSLIRSGATGRAARRAYERVGADEAEHMADATLNLLHDGTHVVMNKRLAEDAAEIVTANDGHIVPAALRAGHFETDTRIPQVSRNRINFYNITEDAPKHLRETDRFTGFRSSEEDFPKYWGRALNEAQRDEGARLHAAAYARAIRAGGDVQEATRAAIRTDEAWLRAPEQADVVSDMMRSRVPGIPGEDPLLSFARTRVEATKGLSHFTRFAEDGTPIITPNMPIIDQLANEEARFAYDDLARIEPANRPLIVKGRVRVPDTGGNMIEKLTDVGFRRIVDPLVNALGREHQYLLEYSRVRRTFDSAIDEGLFTQDEAVQRAQEIAVKRVARFIHNPHERTQFSTLIRNFAPFYFAQEQSYRRLGRLLATDPQAFRQYQLANMAMTDFIHHQTDAEGRSHAVIPGLGFLDETGVNALAALGLPIAQAAPTAILGNVNSLDSVLPFNEFNVEGARPSWSVFVTVPGKALADVLPESRDGVRDVIGDLPLNGAMWEQIMPSTALRNGIKALTPRSVDSATIATAQALAYRQNVAMSKWVADGHKPTDPGAPRIVPPPDAGPQERKAFRERVRNQARITLAFKAIVSEFSPLAPSADIGDYGVKSDMAKAISKYGITEGLQRYLEKHPDATPYTVFATEVKGVPVQPYKVSQDFVDKHGHLFDKYPAAAGYLIPQVKDGKYDPAVYQEQLALGLREKKGYDKFVDDMYVSEGFAAYEADLKFHEAELRKVEGDPEAVKAENADWHDYLAGTLAKQNPVWWDYFTSPDRQNRRTRELDQLRALVKDKSTPNTSLTRGIRGLLGDLDYHLQILDNGRIDGWSREDRQAELDDWQDYLNGVADKHPELGMVITRLFKYVGN